MVRYTLSYLRTFFGSLVDPQVRPYLVAAANLLAVGTIFYSLVEGWTPLMPPTSASSRWRRLAMAIWCP